MLKFCFAGHISPFRSINTSIIKQSLSDMSILLHWIVQQVYKWKFQFVCMNRNQYHKIRRKHLYNLSRQVNVMVSRITDTEDQQLLYTINSENRRTWRYSKRKN